MKATTALCLIADLFLALKNYSPEENSSRALHSPSFKMKRLWQEATSGLYQNTNLVPSSPGSMISASQLSGQIDWLQLSKNLAGVFYTPLGRPLSSMSDPIGIYNEVERGNTGTSPAQGIRVGLLTYNDSVDTQSSVSSNYKY